MGFGAMGVRRERGVPLRPREALGRTIESARALRRRNAGFAAVCAIVRTSPSDGLDRVLTNALDETARATTVAEFLKQFRRAVRVTPRRTLGQWVQQVTLSRGRAV